MNMPRQIVTAVLAGGLILSCQLASAASQQSNGVVPQAFVTEFCVPCHSERLKVAGLVLEHLDESRPELNAATWEKVIRKLRAGMMPPPGTRRPAAPTVQSFIASLESSIDSAAAKSSDSGRSLVHRLNRSEYVNAIRDLLALDIDGHTLLPSDDSSYGFDNIADVQTVSPALLDRYLVAAKKISRLTIPPRNIRPSSVTYKNPVAKLQDEREGEDLPFGSRGGLTARHVFPVSGDYRIHIRLQRNSINLANAIRGMDEDNTIDVYVDGELVATRHIPRHGGPRDVAGAPESTMNAYGADRIDASLRFAVPVSAGTRVVGVTFPRRHWYMEGVGVERLPAASEAFNSGLDTSRDYGKIEMGVESVEISGPFQASRVPDTSSRKHIFVCTPSSPSEENGCATTILSRLARLGYRRPVTKPDMNVLLAAYRRGRAAGEFGDGIREAIERILVSPFFLFRAERDPRQSAPGSVVRVGSIELASRLSFFLWSSIPDDELLKHAEANTLSNPRVLGGQVRRMLADRRSAALIKNFFGQLFYLRNVASHSPDQKLYPEFDDNLRDAMARETELFLQTQLHENRSVIEMLTAEYSFLNERLARHYGVSNVYGSRFRRVSVPAERAGLLGHASILTVTSYPDRTSPVLRGKWLLENLFGAPPPPPPPDVPPFPTNESGAQQKSVRELMEQHRRNPACSVCHAHIDPLGFALDNFDAIGRYRSTEVGIRIDASGTLPNGTRFDGPQSFRQLLVRQERDIVAALAERMLTYALGRGVEHYDMPAIRDIVRRSEVDGHRWSSLIAAIVTSRPFQTRRASL